MQRIDFMERLNPSETIVFLQCLSDVIQHRQYEPLLKYNVFSYLWLVGRSRYERLLIASLRPRVFSYPQTMLEIDTIYNDVSYPGDALCNLYEFLEIIKPPPIYVDPPRDILVPVGEEFACFLRFVFTVGYPTVRGIIRTPPPIIPKPSSEEALTGIMSMRSYAERQGPYRPARNYLFNISEELAIYIWWWRRYLLFLYGIETGNTLIVKYDQAEKIPLPTSFLELGAVRRIDGVSHPRPKDYLLDFCKEVMQRGERTD